MTVANVILEPHRVRLISDTVGYLGKAPAVLHRKLRAVPHAKLAFIARGKTIFAEVLEEFSESWTDFPGATAAIKHILETAHGPTMFSSGRAEVTLIGFCGGAPRATRLSASDDGDRVAIECNILLEGVYLAPGLGGHAIPAALSDDQAFRIALLQQDISLKHGMNMCVGGDVECAEVSASGVDIKTLGEYPDKQMTIARIEKLDLLGVEQEIAA